MVPMFDIFSGRFPERDALCVESVEGLAEAYQRMLCLAAKQPGPYFVFSSYTHKSVACVDTTKLLGKYEDECAWVSDRTTPPA